MIAKVLRDRIVADVSGDLSPSESEQLLYELLQMPDARHLHQSLQRDRESIQGLYRLSADSELPNRVLGVLAKQTPIIRLTSKPTTPTKRWPQFVGLALGLALAFVGAWMISNRTRPAVVDRPANPEENQLVQGPKEPVEKPTVIPEKTPDEVVIEGPETPANTPNAKPAVKPEVKSSNDVLTAPKLPKLAPVEAIKPRISLPMMASDLTADATREPFKKELKGYREHRIELFSHDTSKLADDIVKILRAKDPPIIVEQPVAEAIRRKAKGPTVQYAAYLESCSADELMAHLRTLARDGKFETLVLTPINEGDHRELRTLLGRDPMEPPTEIGSKADAKRPAGDAAPVSGYISFFPPTKVAGQTKDQKAYWDRRADRSPGKLRLYLILRPL